MRTAGILILILADNMMIFTLQPNKKNFSPLKCTSKIDFFSILLQLFTKILFHIEFIQLFVPIIHSFSFYSTAIIYFTSPEKFFAPKISRIFDRINRNVTHHNPQCLFKFLLTLVEMCQKNRIYCQKNSHKILINSFVIVNTSIRKKNPQYFFFSFFY